MSAAYNVNEVTALEYSTLKVPYELLNKKFRAAQKLIDQQVFHQKKSNAVLCDQLTKYNGPIAADTVSLQ